MKRLIFAFMFTLTLTAGCGNPGEAPEMNKQSNDGHVTSSKIERAKQLLKADKCNDEGCAEESEIRFSDGQFAMEPHNGEAIMVTEGEISRYLPVLRFRSRFKALYRFHDGNLRPWDPSIEVSKRFARVARMFDTAEFQSSRQTAPLVEVAQKTHDSTYSDYNRGHNVAAVGSIIEHNPRNPMVALTGLRLAPMFGKTRLCQGDKKALRTHGQKIAEKLKTVFAEHSVRYVNMSTGFTPKWTRKEFRRACGEGPSAEKVETIRAALRPVFSAMGNNEEVLLVQSAGYKGNSGPLDCDGESFPYRVRAGGINKLDADLTAEGRSQDYEPEANPKTHFEELYELYDGTGTCADVFVNLNLDWNMEDMDEAFKTPYTLGFGLWQVSIMPSTSRAAPLALSWVVHLRQKIGGAWTSRLIEEIKSRLTPKTCDYLPGGRCVFQDPLAHGQVEVDRLGHRE